METNEIKQSVKRAKKKIDEAVEKSKEVAVAEKTKVKTAVTKSKTAVKNKASEVKNEVKRSISQRRNKDKKKELAPKKLEILITIVNRSKTEFYQDIIQQYESNMQMAISARGTAATEMLQMLGLGDNSKTVIISVIRQDIIPRLSQVLEEKFRTVNNGSGVAFTVPMSSLMGVDIYRFLTNNRKEVKEN